MIRSLRYNDSSADLARILDDGKTPSLEVATAPPTTTQKLVKLFTGAEPGQTRRGAGPTARSKIVLISLFLALHVLNLCTTLTATTAIHRHSAHSGHHYPSPSSSHASSKLDPNGPIVASALAKLALAQPKVSVHLEPAIQLRAALPGTIVEPPIRSIYLTSSESSAASSLALLDTFMSSWTRLVGDPVMSKWIVIALGISVFLNGYLLKGIATGAGSESYAPASAAQEAARILLASTGADLPAQLERERQAKRTRRWSDGVETARAAARGGKLPDDEEAEESPVEEKIRRASQSSDDSQASSTLYVRQPRRRTGTVVRKPQPVSMTPTLHGLGADLTVTQGNTPGTATPMTLPSSSTAPSLISSRQQSSAGDESTTDTSDESLSQLPPRPLADCEEIFNGGEGATALSDEEIIIMVQKGKMAAYALEKLLKDYPRAVRIRRALICE